MKLVGVIGGMGPAATLNYFSKIIKKTKSSVDQNHIPICIWNDPSIPDRTKSILSKDTNNVKNKLISVAKKLEKNDCMFLTIPCNTAHYWISDIQNSINIPCINMIDETMKIIKSKNIKEVGLLSTKGTIKTEIYQNIANNYDININYPSDSDIKKVSQIISNIKSNNYNYEFENKKLDSIIEKMQTKNVILGCTELPLVYKSSNHIIDPVEILAEKTIQLFTSMK